jgi:hypothetical protein
MPKQKVGTVPDDAMSDSSSSSSSSSEEDKKKKKKERKKTRNLDWLVAEFYGLW